jgi:hypothetical protein
LARAKSKEGEYGPNGFNVVTHFDRTDSKAMPFDFNSVVAAASPSLNCADALALTVIRSPRALKHVVKKSDDTPVANDDAEQEKDPANSGD